MPETEEQQYATSAGGNAKPTELKLINDGTYGCVFHPGITCKGKQESLKYITKIQMNKRSIKNELRVSEKIKRIEGYARFFAPVLKDCVVRIAKEHSSEMLKCGIFENKDTNEALSREYVSTKIRFVGDVDLSKYLLFNVKPARFLSELWRTHSYVLKAIHKMTSNGIVHYDLKDNNILFDAALNLPIIIDFGLSFLKTDLKSGNFESIFFVFADYNYWCIDIIACSYIFNDVGYELSKTETVREHELLEIYKVFLYGTNHISTHGKLANLSFEFHSDNSSETLDEFKMKYMKYFGKFVGKTWWSVYEELIQFVDTWDNYSAAAIYTILLKDARRANKSLYDKVIGKNRERADRYINGLKRIIYAMPNERMSANEALQFIPK
jgi:serine/threonine protein kinase